MVKFGKVFFESLEISKRRRTTLKDTRLTGWGARITFLYIILIVCFFVLLVRLFHLTVVKGEENRSLSEENRVRTAVVYAPRGILYDRLGRPLVENLPSVRITELCETGTMCPSERLLEEEWQNRTVDKSRYFVEKDVFRHYLHPYETAHIVGYLGEMTSEELENPYYIYQDYAFGDWLGRMGLEQVFEDTLRGTNGKELIEVDSRGMKIRTLGEIDAISGVDMTFSIDAEIQKVAYEAMGENPGAVVVTKAKTGEILALVSTPSFDPNAIHRGLSQEAFTRLLESLDRPLFNKAISGVYPPGSTFKIVSAVAALESGAVTKNTVVEDIGILRIGEFSFGNWYFSQYGKTEGTVDMLKGIARSNDIFFYKLGERTRIETIAEWGKKLGVGEKTGIELPGEAEGVMPDPSWRKKVKGSEWYLGDTYHIAIGQGELQTTPLQMNLWTNVIASGGVKCRPTLLKTEDRRQKTDRCDDLNIKKETIDLITEGMRRACYRGEDIPYQGTGWPFFDFSVTKEQLSASGGTSEKRMVPVACKTGTSETGAEDKKTHAWFTAFAPLPAEALAKAGLPSNISTITGNPEIVVTVLVEKGGEGSTVAGPIAKKIMEAWFKR